MLIGVIGSGGRGGLARYAHRPGSGARIVACCDARRREDEPGNPEFVKEHWPPLRQTGFNPKMDVEDQTVMIMEMENGVLGAYRQCHFTPDAYRNYTFIGTEGRIENIGDEPDSPIFLWNRRSDIYHMVGDEVHYGEPIRGGGHGGADPLIVEEFLRLRPRRDR